MKIYLVTLTEDEANDGRTLFVPSGPSTPMIRGRGDIDFVCAECEFLIAARMSDPARLDGVAFRCPGCAAYQGSRT
jgi:hypothetical protein